MSFHRSRQECLDWLRSTPRSIAPGQKVETGPFQPADAEGVARLYHAVYGETFPLDYVYDPRRIAEANRGPDLHQYVARTPTGDVVGVAALFRAAPGAGILETGGLMVLPSYRGGALVFSLSQATMVDLPLKLGLNALFGQSVCDHLLTQKLTRRFGFSGFALELESMPARPATSHDGVGGRISLLNEFRIFHDLPHRVFPPAEYAAWLRQCYQTHGLSREFGSGAPLAGATQSATETVDSAAVAKLVVHVPGVDLATVIQALERQHPDRHAYQLHLPLAHPALPAAVTVARHSGYFLGGVLPLWTDRDVLLLQKVAGAPDFSRPCLLTEEARQLLRDLQQDRRSVSAGVDATT